MQEFPKVINKMLAVLLCLSICMALVCFPSASIQASGAGDEAYLNRCYHSIMNLSNLSPTPRIIAYAYLVGEDDVVTPSWLHNFQTHPLYAVHPDTEIQGYHYDSRYYPQDNLDYLKDVKENYTNNFHASNKIYNMPAGAQYIEREGCKYAVVACDEEWVTVWDRGYQKWNPYRAADGMPLGEGCQHNVDDYMETHPAGFYKIPRKKVWIDFGLAENHPYDSEERIPSEGEGVVTKLVKLRPVPDEGHKTYTAVYALPMGTKLNVVSKQLVPSRQEGSTRKFYEVSFNGGPAVGNNTVGYMKYKVPGVYYVDSRYVNVKWKGLRSPADTVPGEITNVKENESVYVYRSKNTDSERVGILCKGVEIEIFPSESDAEWTTVYFSGRKAFVQTKYVKRAEYKVEDISKPYIADIVNDEIVIGFRRGKNNVEFSCSIATTANHNGKAKVLWAGKLSQNQNQFVIKRAYIEKASALDIAVQATDKNGRQGKKYTRRILLPTTGRRLEKKKLIVGRNKITSRSRSISLGSSLQYSTKKNFKKAVTVERYYNKNGKCSHKPIRAIKKLKAKKTYYVRRRYKKVYMTAKGKKWLSGKWSKPIRVRTKAKK